MDAIACKGYDARVAQRLLESHHNHARVDFVQRGDGSKLASPAPGVIQYVKATGGKWGRSSETRMGAPLNIEDPLLFEVRKAHVAMEMDVA